MQDSHESSNVLEVEHFISLSSWIDDCVLENVISTLLYISLCKLSPYSHGRVWSFWCANLRDVFLSGSALLVHPVTDAGSTGVNVYLPGTDQVCPPQSLPLSVGCSWIWLHYWTSVECSILIMMTVLLNVLGNMMFALLCGSPTFWPYHLMTSVT